MIVAASLYEFLRILIVFKEGTAELNSETLQRFLLQMLKEIQKNEDAWPFLLPVTKEEVR